jgi:hypothetical protein
MSALSSVQLRNTQAVCSGMSEKDASTSLLCLDAFIEETGVKYSSSLVLAAQSKATTSLLILNEGENGCAGSLLLLQVTKPCHSAESVEQL